MVTALLALLTLDAVPQAPTPGTVRDVAAVKLNSCLPGRFRMGIDRMKHRSMSN